jgi:branched-subunit amino acid permease
MSLFEYVPHPHIAARQQQRPRKVSEQHKTGFNGTLARGITEGVGTMWCAYVFAALALVALPQAVKGGSLTIVQWISQTFLQLVLLSIIMVGQQVIGAASDERATHTYEDAEAILHEAQQIQAHLAVQDAALESLAARLGAELGQLNGATAVRQSPPPPTP